MKHPSFPLLMVALLLSSPNAVWAQETPPPVESDIGIGDTSVGDKSDVGSPDSLDGIETGDNQPPPPEVAPAPSFDDPVSSAAESAPTPEAAPAAQNAETAPAAPKTKRSKGKKRSQRVVERHPDGPDFRREKNFNRIYMEFNEQPTPTEAWDQAAGGSASKVYNVQKGDTLWDLSKTLFGDSAYWPKIWSLNTDEIYNPHEIDTWMNVRFFPGDLNEPPSITIDQSQQLAAADALPAAEGEVAPAEVNVPIPPAKKRAPVIKNIPGSLPLYRYEVVNQPPPDFGQVKPPPVYPRPPASLSYYVSERAPNSVGKVRETELGGPTASEYQYVFVEAPSAGRFVIVKDMGPLKGYENARVIEVQGEIEVLEPASDVENLQRAIVRRSLNPIEVGSVLVPGSIEKIDTQDGSPVAGPALKIIGSQFGGDRRMTDAEGFVFLNGGSAMGLQVGQILPIYADRTIRNATTSVRLGGKLIGHVRVVKTSPNYATGFLTKMTDDVLVGDDVGRRSVSGSALAPLPQVDAVMDEEGDVAAPVTDEDLSAELSFEDGAAPLEAPSLDDEVAPPVEEHSSSDEELNLDEAEF